jgi:hypothetical protein
MKEANRATLTGYPVLFLMGLSATAPFLPFLKKGVDKPFYVY